MSLKIIKELNRQNISVQNTPEFLGQSAQYKLEKVIPTYSTDLMQAYTVVQINASQKHSQLYADVSKHPEVIDFSRFISFLNFTYNKNILPIIDCGITVLDGNEVFAMVLPYLLPEKLLANNMELFTNKSEIVLQKVIMPILELLVQLHSMDLTHGCINQDNIWIEFDIVKQEVEQVFLSNSALEIPGYSQISNYEPLNRMLVHKAGKAISKSADCYAVGILLASLISEKFVSRKGYEHTVSSKAKVGSYKTIVNELFAANEDTIGKVSKYALYWLLHDDEEKRWTAQQALKFLRRRHRKLTLDNIAKITQEDERANKFLEQPLKFSGEECYSMTEAAISSIRHYDDIKLRVKNGKLIKELLNNKNISPSFITKVSDLRLLVGFKSENGISSEEFFLTLFIILLNNQMPVKLKDVAFQVDAFWQMSKYILHNFFISIVNTWSSIINQHQAIYLNISKVCEIKVNKIIPMLGLLSNPMSFMSGHQDKNSVYILKEKICFSVSDIVDILSSLDEKEMIEVIHNKILIGLMLGKLYFEKIKMPGNSLIDPTKDDFALFFFTMKLYCESTKQNPKQIAVFIKNMLMNKYVKQIKSTILKNKIVNALTEASSGGDISKMYQIITSQDIDKKQDKYKNIVQKVSKLKGAVASYNAILSDDESLRSISREKTIKIASSVFLATLLFIFYKLFWI